MIHHRCLESMLNFDRSGIRVSSNETWSWAMVNGKQLLSPATAKPLKGSSWNFHTMKIKMWTSCLCSNRASLKLNFLFFLSHFWVFFFSFLQRLISILNFTLFVRNTIRFQESSYFLNIFIAEDSRDMTLKQKKRETVSDLSGCYASQKKGVSSL